MNVADNSNDETTTGEAEEAESEVVDLSEASFSFEELSDLHDALVAEYQEARSTVEMTDDNGYEALTARFDAIQLVRSEIEARIVQAEMDKAVAESVELTSDFKTRMAAASTKKEAPVVELAEAAVLEAPVEEAPAVEPVAVEEEPEVPAEVPAEDETEEVETPEEAPAEVEASSEELVASNTEDTTTANKEATVPTPTQLSPAGLPSDRPIAEAKSNVVVASADVPGFAAGQELHGLADMAKAFMHKRPRIQGTDAGNDGYRYHVLSILGDFPDERYLSGDLNSNMEKIDAVSGPEAITASGGFCAPLTPYYSLLTFGETQEPVRDSLPNFKADRGGIRFMPPPRLSDVVDSVRRTTATQDAAGYTNQSPAGTTAPKPCLHVTCLAEQSVVIEAISRCLTFGNLGARTFPEQVEAWIKLSLVQFARYSEVEILDAIAAASTSINAAPLYGFTASFLEQITRATAALRFRHRISQGTRFRAIIPAWAREQVRADLGLEQAGDGLERLGVTDAQVEAWFSARGINVTWHIDYDTIMGVPFGTQSAGALLSWPARVEWFLFPEGSFLYLDGGSIDLGLVRDSTLNSQNDYQIWSERFQGVAFVGVESYRVVSHLCVNGAFAAPVAPGSCTGS